MSGKRRTLWRGSVEVTEEEELDIAITTHLPSQRGQETFDWKVKNDEVGLVCLRNSGLKTYFRRVCFVCQEAVSQGQMT